MKPFASRRIGTAHVVALSRHGGLSAPPYDTLNVAQYVGDNPENVAGNIDLVRRELDANDIAVMNAEHGTRVLVVTVGGDVAPADGLMTQTPGLALLALAADCVPVALVVTHAQRIAVFHAGWKGVLANIAHSTVEQMVAHGSHSQHITAVIGPSICHMCYEVSEERTALFEATLPEAIHDSRHLNLVAGVTHSLEEYGVTVDVIPGCTLENDDLFSYRRNPTTGRGGIAVVMSKVDP